MKQFIKIFGVIAIFAISTTNLNAQKLKSFGADLGKKKVMGKEVRVPYTDVISYFGYVKPGAEPDGKKDGKNFYYLYVWIPAAAPELGVRMISPVPKEMKAKKSNVVSPDYEANKSDKKNYFDTWISLEKAEGITSINDVVSKGTSANWNVIQKNDDSGEMPKQPSGRKYNSLMRIKSKISDPLKALTTGLYRVGFTTFKTGEVKGSFLAQIGSPVKLPGVKIAKTLEEIQAK